MNEIIEIFTETINSDYHLDREDTNWLIPDTDEKWIQVAGSLDSIGFSLDVSGQPNPLAFFSNRPKKYLEKMCDALMATIYRDKLYLFAIELKSGWTAKHRKQLANGRHFWYWLAALCKEHGYLTVEALYIGVLVYKPKKQVRKGTTAHRNNGGIEKVSTHNGFDTSFEIQNRNEFRLENLIKIHIAKAA